LQEKQSFYDYKLATSPKSTPKPNLPPFTSEIIFHPGIEKKF